MFNTTAILDDLRQRTDRHTGLALASDYVKSVWSCLNDAECAAKLGGFTADQWTKCVKDGDTQLVYRNPDMIVKETITGGGSTLTPGALMDIEYVLTTNQPDRDKDIMEPGGAEIDEQGPLLMQHVPMLLIGKFLKVVSRDESKIIERSSIADLHSHLTDDAAYLFAFGALRISVGFNPIEAEPVKAAVATAVGSTGKTGWRVKRWTVLERSGVSIPANPGAVILGHSRQKLHDPVIKAWAMSLYEARPVLVQSGWERPPVAFASLTDFYEATGELESHAS